MPQSLGKWWCLDSSLVSLSIGDRDVDVRVMEMKRQEWCVHSAEEDV